MLMATIRHIFLSPAVPAGSIRDMSGLSSTPIGPLLRTGSAICTRLFASASRIQKGVVPMSFHLTVPVAIALVSVMGR